MALASWTVELSWLFSLTDTDATVTFAPSTAYFAIRCPAATKQWLRGQSAHTVHLAKDNTKCQLFSFFQKLDKIQEKYSHLCNIEQTQIKFNLVCFTNNELKPSVVEA